MNPPTDQNDVSTALGLLRDSLSEEEQRILNLTSNLPLIPAVKTFADFRAFSRAGSP